MNAPFGIEYLEPGAPSDDPMGSQVTCSEQTTFHTKSGTTTLELVCDD